MSPRRRAPRFAASSRHSFSAPPGTHRGRRTIPSATDSATSDGRHQHVSHDDHQSAVPALGPLPLAATALQRRSDPAGRDGPRRVDTSDPDPPQTRSRRGIAHHQPRYGADPGFPAPGFESPWRCATAWSLKPAPRAGFWRFRGLENYRPRRTASKAGHQASERERTDCVPRPAPGRI
jgi:hypothetical protein